MFVCMMQYMSKFYCSVSLTVSLFKKSCNIVLVHFVRYIKGHLLLQTAKAQANQRICTVCTATVDLLGIYLRKKIENVPCKQQRRRLANASMQSDL